MGIRFQCVGCGKPYDVRSDLAGRSIECTACGAKVRVPKVSIDQSEVGGAERSAKLLEEYARSDPWPDPMRLKCSCGAMTRVAWAKSGKMLPCGSCGQSLYVPMMRPLGNLDEVQRAPRPAGVVTSMKNRLRRLALGLLPPLVLLPIFHWFISAMQIDAKYPFLFWLPEVFYLVWALLWIMLDREQCARHIFGNVNPAIVVGVNPTMLAVGTDLAKKGHPPAHAVKIVACQPMAVQKSDGKPPEIGQRLTTVATYQASGDPNAPCWVNFYPVPTVKVNDDPAVVRYTESLLTDADWQDLEQRTTRLPQPYQSGLYLVPTGGEVERISTS